ncbi:MAG TPA: choice-of-anchor tandem repeat GloVer-containing protein [Candidatus Methylomirabilis sp.]|nr:choice-of-anchor tandem repeat GloVer-containing protein [Candidatus Methylomirabilis sp.]
MGTRLRARWSFRYARALPALLLSLLGVLLLPPLAQGAAPDTSYKVLYAFPLSPPPQPPPDLPPAPVTPSGLLMGADGNFYGTTSLGGANDLGGVFKLTPTGTLTTLYSFTGQTDGVYPAPSAGLIRGSDGNFYGTTSNGGGSDDLGTVFKLTPTGTLTTLHAFTVAKADGAYPAAGLVQDPTGNLYGTTSEKGGPGFGTVFKLTQDGTFTTLHSFTGTDGENPLGGLVRDPGGNLYGTTSSGGTHTYGTVFKLTPSGSTFTLTTLHAFTGTTGQGANPQGTLLRDPGGTLYGTTYGGASNRGTVFSLVPTADPNAYTFSPLHEFSGTDGANPAAGLLLGADGNLYGTTLGDCTYGDVTCTSTSAGKHGTVFRLAPDGSAFTTLHTFGGAEGANPQTPLIQDPDGHFYGTTSQGGGAGSGGVAFVLRVGNALTVTLPGPGTGTVSSVPAGISCPGTCTEVFPVTSTVTLTATPDASFAVTWSGDCTPTGNSCTVVDMSAPPRTVTATFTPQSLELSVSKAGTGAGTVTSSPAGITCGGTCTVSFAYGTAVTLTPAPAAGCTFTGWSGDADCSDGVVTLTGTRTCTATFADPTLPVVTHTPVTSWKENTAIPITATITDNMVVQGATLYYRTKGVGSFSSLPMTPGATYSRSIPAGVVVRPAGVEYYLEAADAAGNVRRLPSASGTYGVVVGTSSFIDDPLGAGTSVIKAVHFTELLTAINAVRTKAPYNLPAFTWTGTAPAASGAVRASHLADLRTALTAPALNAAYKGKYGKDITFGEAITAGVVIKASHLSELRMYVRALE